MNKEKILELAKDCGIDWFPQTEVTENQLEVFAAVIEHELLGDSKPVAWIIYRHYTIEKERILDDDVLLTENIDEDLDQINKYEQPNERWWAEAPLYDRPQKPLTDEQIDALQLPESGAGTIRDLVRIIEAAHGIGGV